jgi:hypothetical protein
MNTFVLELVQRLEGSWLKYPTAVSAIGGKNANLVFSLITGITGILIFTITS